MTSASKGLVVMACVGLVGLLISLAAHVSRQALAGLAATVPRTVPARA